MKAVKIEDLDVLIARLEAHAIELRAAFPKEFRDNPGNHYNQGFADGLEEAKNTVAAARDRLAVELVTERRWQSGGACDGLDSGVRSAYNTELVADYLQKQYPAMAEVLPRSQFVLQATVLGEKEFLAYLQKAKEENSNWSTDDVSPPGVALSEWGSGWGKGCLDR